jgi:hypothetical protein
MQEELMDKFIESWLGEFEMGEAMELNTIKTGEDKDDDWR